MKVPCPRCHTNVALLDRPDGTKVAWQSLPIAEHSASSRPGAEPVPCPASGEAYGAAVHAVPGGE